MLQAAPPLPATATPGLTPRWLGALAKVVAVAAFVVVVAGSAVTSTRSGDADPDWPLFEGRPLPSPSKMAVDRGKFYEHGHRVAAASLGILTLVLAGCLQTRSESRRWVKALGLAAGVTVVLLAVLGGIRVLTKDLRVVPIIHVAVAMPFLGICTALAVVTARRWWAAAAELQRSKGCPVEDARALAWTSLATAIALYVQAVLGAIPRHLYEGALPHILGAFAVSTLAILLAARILSKHSGIGSVFRPGMGLLGLIVAQFFLGFSTYVVRPAGPKAPGSGFYEALASTHLAVGALLLVVAVVLSTRSFRIWGLAAEQAQVSSASTEIALERGGES